jgi:AcrR family transcriptional regulator
MQLRSVETQNKILEVSLALFSMQGYASTTVDEICSGAGISKGAFYHHFPEKHAVFAQLLQKWADEIQIQVDQRIHDSPNLLEGLSDISRSINDVISESRSKFPMLVEFWRQSLENPVLWKKAISPFYQYEKYFNKLIYKDIEDTGLQLENPEVVARIFLAFSLGIIAAGVLDPESNWSITAAEGFSGIFRGFSRR